MKTSLWLNVDRLALYDPIQEEEFYFDGEHNGGIFNSGNLSNYNYCYQNPIKFIDPDGKQVESFATNTEVENLVIINYGYDGNNRPRGKTQSIGADDGLINIKPSGNSLKIVSYASSATNSTKEDIKATISNFKKVKPNGQVILIGHSGGADNNVELVKENPQLKINILITLDARDPDKFGWTDTNILQMLKMQLIIIKILTL